MTDINDTACLLAASATEALSATASSTTRIPLAATVTWTAGGLAYSKPNTRTTSHSAVNVRKPNSNSYTSRS